MACQIVFHSGNCLNNKKPFVHPCRLCIESCPHQAITEDHQIDDNKCTECGICMAICPSDGFVDRRINDFHDYLLSTKEVILNCPQTEENGFEIPCLGIMDRDRWITLMILAKENKVAIHTGECAECEDSQACSASVQIFKQVHSDWVDHPAIQIHVHSVKYGKVDQTSTKGISSESTKPYLSKIGWRKKSWDKVEQLLPRLSADETYPIPNSRECLLELLEKKMIDKIPFRALTVTDSCTSCGVCASICPQGALYKLKVEVKTTPEPMIDENISKIRLILEPRKCVHCERCVRVCNTQALSFHSKQLSHDFLEGKILIHEGSPTYCARCGKQLFENTELCRACSTLDPDSRLNFTL